MDIYKLIEEDELLNITNQECIECLDYIISGKRKLFKYIFF